MLFAEATGRVWMKSAIVERELGNIEEERNLLNEGLNQFPSFYELWLMLGQLHERLAANQHEEDQGQWYAHMMEAKKIYCSGLKILPNSVPLWLSLASIEEKTTNEFSKVRAVLTLARKNNPHNPELFLASVRAELKHGYKKQADFLMSKALKECPNSGILLAASIDNIVPPPKRKNKCIEALNKCDHDPHVIASMAKLFWIDRMVDETRSWLNRAVTLAPSIGDFWALCYKFELEHGTEENQNDVLKRCVAAEPKHGEKWQAVSMAVENYHQPTEFILNKVVIAIANEEKAAEDCKL